MEYLNKHKESKRGYYDSEAREFMVGYIPHRSGTYRIEIDGVLETVSQFSTAIQVLENAKEEDEIIIYLQTPGGSVSAGEALIHAMRKCAAPIHIVATGGVHSMGTCILLEADSIELSNGFHACLHIGSDGAYGNGNEYFIKAEFDINFKKRIFRETYEGFLSDTELDDMINGKDIWLDATGWLERATARSEYFKAKYAAMQAAEEAEDGMVELTHVGVAEPELIPKKPRKRKPLTIANKDVDTSEEVV